MIATINNIHIHHRAKNIPETSRRQATGKPAAGVERVDCQRHGKQEKRTEVTKEKAGRLLARLLFLHGARDFNEPLEEF